MTHRESAFAAVTPKGVAGFAILLLVLAAFFGLLNSQKMRTLRATVATAQAARDAAERGIRGKLNPAAGSPVEDQGKVAQAENRAAKAEAELAQIQKEKADLQTKLDENQKEIASLQTPVQEAEKNPNASPADNSATAPAADLQSQSMIFAVNWTARKKKSLFSPKSCRPPKIAPISRRKERNAGKLSARLPPSEQVCAGRSLQSIRPTTSWY